MDRKSLLLIGILFVFFIGVFISRLLHGHISYAPTPAQFGLPEVAPSSTAAGQSVQSTATSSRQKTQPPISIPAPHPASVPSKESETIGVYENETTGAYSLNIQAGHFGPASFEAMISKNGQAGPISITIGQSVSELGYTITLNSIDQQVVGHVNGQTLMSYHAVLTIAQN